MHKRKLSGLLHSSNDALESSYQHCGCEVYHLILLNFVPSGCLASAKERKKCLWQAG